jgi:hypothetical protein
MSEAEITIPGLFAALIGYQRTGTLKGAIDLDLFTSIAEGNDTVAALARRVGAAERGVRIHLPPASAGEIELVGRILFGLDADTATL